ncbi:MAG: hypothetical protein J6K19_03190 [Prevotella sp.]|nr:hypothetical protein [Prevotella sp.]
MMEKAKFLFIFLLLSIVSCKEDGEVIVDEGKTAKYKVAVVAPAALHEEWKQIAAWAAANIGDAQKGLSSKVAFDITWIDEDAADLSRQVRAIAEDESFAAILGPRNSSSAMIVAVECVRTSKPLIVPAATSAEYQRIFAGNNVVWNMAQSDITECEMLLTQAKLTGAMKVELIASNDYYGKSFIDWFAFLATELGLTVDGIVAYDNEETMREAVARQMNNRRPWNKAVIFVPGSEDYAIAFDDEIKRLKEEWGNMFTFPSLFCSDMMYSNPLEGRLNAMTYEGISPTADPTSGFIDAFKAHIGREPAGGSAHFYDALLLAAYSLATLQASGKMPDGGEALSAAILQTVDGRDAWSGSWMPADMHTAFAMIAEGRHPDLRGVTGDWTFDGKSHASVLNTTYAHWIMTAGEYHTMEYLSPDGGGRTTSTLQAWDWRARSMQTFDEQQTDIGYGPHEANWAVVIATSDTWSNYRHQADALAMYQLLRRHGYDDEHIIFVSEDNLAYHPNNLHPGEIRVRPDGENLHHDVTVDYRLSDITIADLKEIMLGNTAYPERLGATGKDNVIVFWCGHGGWNRLAWGDNTISARDVRGIVEAMHDAGRYRKMLFVIDACYSGSIGEACSGVPGVLIVTAANPAEPSKADMKDTEMGIWLSNGFTRAFQETVDERPDITLRDLYYTLARNTVGSHATVYNAACYGNLFHSSMAEYLNR